MKSVRLVIKIALCLCLIFAVSPALAAANLRLSAESGFYADEIQLTITCSQKNSVIYYTLDGTSPKENGLVYEGPLTLGLTTQKEDPLSQIVRINPDEDYIPPQDFPSAHVIRAQAQLANGKWSDEVCGTYFIGYDRQELYGDLPIISLIMNPDDLFDYETGIYVMGKVFDEWRVENPDEYEGWRMKGNYSKRGAEWERPVTVDFLMSEEEHFSMAMGVRIKGGASRSASQKSLRLIARDDYGEKNIKYPLFPANYREADGEMVTKYKSVTLRNGGNDKEHAVIRDPLIQTLAEGLTVDTSATRPAIAFINGEYWGLYTLHEEFSDNYVQYHYDVDNDNVITFKTNEIDDGNEEDAHLYWDMFYFIADNDMTDPALYAAAGEMIDLQSLIDYLAINIYIVNQDGIFENNNWQMWRARIPNAEKNPWADGKWRMMVYDNDFSTGVYEEGKNSLVNNLAAALKNTDLDEWHPARMVLSLLKNEDFKARFIAALCDMRNMTYSYSSVISVLGKMRRAYSPYLGDSFRRFGPSWISQGDPEGHVLYHMENIATFFKGRYSKFPGLVQKAFKLSAPITATVKSSKAALGTVYLNDRDYAITHSLSVQYFPEYPITVTAQPQEGARFVGWKLNNDHAVLSDPSSPTTQVTFTGPFILTAVFEAAE